MSSVDEVRASHIKFLIVTLISLFLTCAVANAATDERDAIVQLEHQWLTAAQQHDSATLARILADDFVDVSAQGVIRDKATAVAGTSAPAGTEQTIHDLHVRVYGDVAIANGVNQVHSTAQGWSVEVPFTDVFVRHDGTWRAVSAQETLRKPPASGAH